MRDYIITKIKRLTPNAILPTYGTKASACCDLHSTSDYTIPPGETVKVGTGIAVQPLPGYVGLIFARSSLGTKGIRPGNCVGVVDSDYTGEVIVPLHNDSSEPYAIYQGDRIAQMMWIPIPYIHLVEVEELNETERGTGGFGSTGV